MPSAEGLEATVSLLRKKIEELEGRIGDLEARLERCPGDACPFCGALEYRVDSSAPAPGVFVERKMLCGECGKGETVTVTPR